MQNVVKFVNDLEIAYPSTSTDPPIFTVGIRSALQGNEENAASTFINNKSIVSFVAGISDQAKQDVLNSTLLAQLAANKQYPDAVNSAEWYKTYSSVLQNVGWVVEGSMFDEFNSGDSLFEMQNAVLGILGAALGSNYIEIIKKALEAVKSLSDSDNRIKMFERNTRVADKGIFQLAAADETNGTVALHMGGFMLTSKNTSTRILFFRTSKDETKLKSSAMKCTLDNNVYQKVRNQILDKLGNVTASYVAAIDI
jgi:hypothetical protein